LAEKKILILEPRRLAAKSAALRMSDILGKPLGTTVGFHIKSEKHVTSETRIIVVTEGIMTRYLQHDPSLESFGIIIFDEYHERHVQSDLSLAFSLQTQEYLRDDLKLLVMSATLNLDGLKTLLGDPPVILSKGISYPVSVVYRDPKEFPVDHRNLIFETSQTVIDAYKNDEGDILVFLPGEKEIRQLHATLSDYFEPLQTDIFPLYGNLTKAEQHNAIRPSRNRKIVLATNIAETSLTIEGIRIVIDSGFERVSLFDPSSGMERLVTQKISKASAEQRTGRAGRLNEGKCYRLWNEMQHHSLSAHRDAEILVCDLTPLRLELAQWGSTSDELQWIDPPPSASLSNAERLLNAMGALEGTTVTPHGSRLVKAGLHPRFSHMIESSRPLGLEFEALMISALLSEADILPAEKRHSDFDERFWILEHSRKRDNTTAVPSLMALKDLCSRLNIRPKETSETELSIGLILSFAYPDRIAKSKGEGKYLSSSGKEFFLPPHDPMAQHEWLVIARSDGNATRSKIHLCSPIAYPELVQHHHSLFHNASAVEWNNEYERVESRETISFGSILLESKPIENHDREQIREKLLLGIKAKGIGCLEWNQATKALQNRLAAFRTYCPDPNQHGYTDLELEEKLEEWLQPYLHNESSLAQCRQLDWQSILLSSLSWDDQKRLDKSFPSHFIAPTGSKIMIDYTDPQAPAIHVRIQEMFGIEVHPSLQDEKIALTVHLLSPALRPIQITQDLPGFWTGSYSDVKKELKGRYPKHYWPDNPLEAEATNKTKKHMQNAKR